MGLDPREVRAKFRGWKLPNGKTWRILEADYTIIIRLVDQGTKRKARWRNQAFLHPTMQKLGESFAESDLYGCQRWVENQFQVKLKDWEITLPSEV